MQISDYSTRHVSSGGKQQFVFYTIKLTRFDSKTELWHTRQDTQKRWMLGVHLYLRDYICLFCCGTYGILWFAGLCQLYETW